MSEGEDGPATKGDLAAVKAEIAGVKAEIADVKSELRAEIAGVKSELKAEIAGVKSELKADIAKLAINIVNTNDRMGTMEDRLSSLIREESAKNAGRIDAFLSRMETYGSETARFPEVLDAHGEKLRDHEIRIAKVESSRGG